MLIFVRQAGNFLNRLSLVVIVLCVCVTTMLQVVYAAGGSEMEADSKNLEVPGDGVGQSEFATLAGGCFWCLDSEFDGLQGVVSKKVGYSGGSVDHPTYQQVSSGNTGHLEVIQLEFDPRVIPYKKVLEIFFENVDPLDEGGQFCDRGEQYKTAIFFHSPQQKATAEQVIREVESMPTFRGKSLSTEVVPFKEFFEAEIYHQDYYKKNPSRYKMYRQACGRDARLKELWHK